MEIRIVTESERAAVEVVLLSNFGAEKPLADGAAGNSPYSSETVVIGPDECRERGARVALAAVCRSHDGAGSYKGRGRWRTVYVVGLKADGPLAVCNAGDRDAEQVGESGFYTRPWLTEEAEQASGGLGLGAAALADALGALGLDTLPPPPPIIVTRHPGLVEVLREQGLVGEDAQVLAHATAADVTGRHVFGVLPLALAAEAESVTEITLNLPPEARGRELTADEVRQYMTGVSRYVVRRT